MSKDDTSKKPSHGAFQVNEGQDGKSYFNRIGAAFEHRDKEGFNVQLDSVPVDGRITLRTLKERVQNQRDSQKGSRSSQHRNHEDNER